PSQFSGAREQVQFWELEAPGQWYAGLMVMGKRYCWLIRHTIPARFSAAVLWVDCRVIGRSSSCAHGDGFHTEGTAAESIASGARRGLCGTGGTELISSAQLLSFVAMLNLWWLECAQNPAVFCYRMSWDLLAPLWRSGRGGDQLPHVRTNPKPAA